MIKHIPYESLYLSDEGWLKSRFHFSFANYVNPSNIQYGPLRVMNDDRIQAKSGFGMHPHHNMEIITYMLKGELTHEDSMGHTERISRGFVQYMSAGTGIEHAEKNEGDEEVHLIQIWIFPEKKGLAPRYGSKEFSLEQRHNKWLHIAGDNESKAPIGIYQDANIYVAEVDAGNTLPFELQTERMLYLKVMEGCVKVNGTFFGQGDAAEIEKEDLMIEVIDNTHILLVEMQNTE